VDRRRSRTSAFSDLLARLRSAKVGRDHLAHRFFRDHDMDFMTRPGREKMIAECEGLIELFKGLDREVEAIVSPQRAGFGVAPERIDEHVTLMEAEAQRAARGAADWSTPRARPFNVYSILAGTAGSPGGPKLT
jgi:hypothetical protein